MLVAEEASLNFNPGGNESDLVVLKQLLEPQAR